MYDRALRYMFGLPIGTAIVGMESMEQLNKNIEIAESYRPLSDEKRPKLRRIERNWYH